MTQPYNPRLFSAKYHSIGRSKSAPSLQASSMDNTMSNPLMRVRNIDYIYTTPFYKIHENLLITKIDISKLTYNRVFQFDFKNNQLRKTEIDISKNDVLIVKTDHEINFLRNIVLAESCLGFSENTKIQGDSKYGLYFKQKGTYFITLSEELCRSNLLVINVL